MPKLNPPIPETIYKNVRQEGSCWVWINKLTPSGYGQLSCQRKFMRAHRLSYQIFKGEIPTGLVIDHLCRNRACVNPDHLEAVTLRENIKRGVNHVAVNMVKTHCKRGHEFDLKNTRIKPNQAGRECRQCEKERFIPKTSKKRFLLSVEKVIEARKLRASGEMSLSQLAEKYGVSNDVIGKAVRGESWKHV